MVVVVIIMNIIITSYFHHCSCYRYLIFNMLMKAIMAAKKCYRKVTE